MTYWLSFVMSNCEFVNFPLASWVRCGTRLYQFLIFARSNYNSLLLQGISEPEFYCDLVGEFRRLLALIIFQRISLNNYPIIKDWL